MAMCVCKYVFNKHVIGWGEGRGSGADLGIYYRGAPCIGEGLGGQGMSPPEAPGN